VNFTSLVALFINGLAKVQGGRSCMRFLCWNVRQCEFWQLP